jgi:hypothetical protein
MSFSRKHCRRHHRHSRKCKQSRRHGSRRHHMRGGSAATSASTYGMEVTGTGASQYSRVFDQSGPYAQVSGNAIIGTQGQNMITPAQMPSAAQLNLIQNGGKKSSSMKRGGFLGEVVNQAIVPFGLVGLQHMYGKRRRGASSRHQSKRRYH